LVIPITCLPVERVFDVEIPALGPLGMPRPLLNIA